MIRRPPRSTRTDTLFPYTTLFRSIQHAQCLFDVSFIHIADGHHPRTRIFKMSASHAPHTDHSFGKLVAGCKKTFPEYMQGNDSKSGQRCSRAFQKCRSAERRVGNECVSTCRSRWTRNH